MNLFVGFFTSAAILFRQELGDRYASLIAVFRMILTVVIFAIVVIWARGYFYDTTLGRFLDVPVVYPTLLMSVLLVAVWITRLTGRFSRLGPLRGDSAPVAFSGHASDLFRSWRNFRNEWRLLDTVEPAALLLAGLLLVLLPPVRVMGLYLMVTAVVVLWQTASDRRVNDSSPSFGGFAAVVPPLPEDASRLSVEQQLLDLPEGLLTLFDDETQSNIRVRRERLEHALGPAHDEQASSDEDTDIRDWIPRGLLSAHPPRYLPYGLLVLILLTAINLRGGDPMGIYQLAPDRWSTSMDSFQRSASVIGLLPKLDPMKPGVLKYALWERVDPQAIERYWTGLFELHRDRVHHAVNRLNDRLVEANRLTIRLIGIELNAEAGFPLFDRLLIRNREASDLWATALAEAGTLRQFVTQALATVNNSTKSPREPEITALQTLAIEVAAQEERSIIITQSVERLQRMLATLEAEEALDEHDRRRTES